MSYEESPLSIPPSPDETSTPMKSNTNQSDGEGPSQFTPQTPLNLPEVSPPYLPKKEIIDSPYTLILDLDETLIHFVN